MGVDNHERSRESKCCFFVSSPVRSHLHNFIPGIFSQSVFEDANHRCVLTFPTGGKTRTATPDCSSPKPQWRGREAEGMEGKQSLPAPLRQQRRRRVLLGKPTEARGRRRGGRVPALPGGPTPPPSARPRPVAGSGWLPAAGGGGSPPRVWSPMVQERWQHPRTLLSWAGGSPPRRGRGVSAPAL